ncbi:MAG: hypothetical protein RDV41_13990, partial [Planctomycetota bacterium]|nr:hypothetical protein [Planctomycetota bacterium]
MLIKRYNNANWDTQTTQRTIVFPTYNSTIAAGGGTDNNYYMYYGYAAAAAAPSSPSATGMLFFDGFESGGFTTGGWTPTGSMTAVFAMNPASGTYCGGVRITGSFTSPEDITRSGLDLSGNSAVYVYYSRRLFENSTGTDTFQGQYNNGAWTDFTGENLSYGDLALTNKSFLLSSNVTAIRFYVDLGSFCAVDDRMCIDDVRIYANHNGTLPSCAASGGETDRGAAGASLAWSEGFNWSPPGIPGANAAVVLDDAAVDYLYALDFDLASTVTILSLELRDTSPGAMTLATSANPLVVSRDLTFGVAGATNGAISNVNGRTIQVGGDWTIATAGSSFAAGTGTVVFNGGAAQTIKGVAATTFNNLIVSAGAAATTLTVNPDAGITTTVGGTLTVNASQELIVASSRSLRLYSAGVSTTGTVSGTVTLKDNSTLDLDGGITNYTTFTVNSGGLLRTSGTSSSARANITSTSDTTTDDYGFALVAADGDCLNLNYFNFRYCGAGGLRVNSDGSPTAVGGLSNGNFDYPSDNGVLVNFIDYNYASTQTFNGCDFKNSGSASGATNVRGAHLTTDSPAGSDNTNHGVITFNNSTGGFSGGANEDDPNTVVAWTPDPTLQPTIVGAVAADASGGGMGIQAGDTVTITFDEATNVPGGMTGAQLNEHLSVYLGATARTWGTIASATWSTSTTLVVTLGTGATLAIGDTVWADDSDGGGPDVANTLIKNVAETLNADGSVALTGTFGADSPDMTMAKADDPKGTQVANADPSDAVVFTFSKAVNAYPVTSATIDTVLKAATGAHTWGTPISAVYSGATTTLTAAYTGTGTLTVADTSAFPNSVATAGTVFVHGDDFTYTGKTATTFTGVADLGDMDNNATVYRKETTTLTAAVRRGQGRC